MEYIAILILSIVIFYLYARYKDYKTMNDYKNSQQFKDRRKDFIDKIDKMKR